MKIPFFHQSDDLIEYLAGQKGLVFLLGLPDSGKTTFARKLAMRTLEKDRTVTLIDSDIGQSSIGPPASIGAKTLKHPWELEGGNPDELFFVGGVSPEYHMLDTVIGTFLLVKKNRKRSDHLILDTTGLVLGRLGFALKYQKIRLTEPDHILLFERDEELLPYIRFFGRQEKIRIFRIAVPSTIRQRDIAARRQYRHKTFLHYLENSHPMALDADRTFFFPCPDVYRNDALPYDILGFEDQEGRMIGMGMFLSFDGQTMHVFGKADDAKKICLVKKGSLNLKEIYLDCHNR